MVVRDANRLQGSSRCRHLALRVPSERRSGVERRHLSDHDSTPEGLGVPHREQRRVQRTGEPQTVDGGDLEQMYDRMNAEFERSEARAQAVSERIDSVESVADDLFEEWADELDQYSDPALRRESEGLLRDTRQQYQQVLAAMHRAEDAMDPVLALFRDQVLVLRHNLNARAIGALENELDNIERATAALIAEMQRAIDEASAFIDAMGA